MEIYNDNIDHSSYYGSRFSWDTPSIKRSIFMGGGDYIYAISEKAITAHNVLTMAKSGSVELPSDKNQSIIIILLKKSLKHLHQKSPLSLSIC